MEKLTVLVVDDDREIVESIAIFLQADGYLVRKAYNGLEALDIVMTENVHLIILDIMMPELDGIKTLLKVRESKNLPIILLSAKSEDADKILELLCRHPGKVFSTEEIYRQVWNDDIVSDNAIAVHVRHIREKIEINPKEPRYLKVVWGVGYKIERSE